MERSFNVRPKARDPACESPGWQFIAGSVFEPKLDSLEESVRTYRPSCQPIDEKMTEYVHQCQMAMEELVHMRGLQRISNS